MIGSSAETILQRTNIGNAKVAGMTKDLGMDSNQYSVSLVVFFVTYVES